MFGENGQEVRVDAQDDGGTGELEGSQSKLSEAQECAACETHFFVDVDVDVDVGVGLLGLGSCTRRDCYLDGYGLRFEWCRLTCVTEEEERERLTDDVIRKRYYDRYI